MSFAFSSFPATHAIFLHPFFTIKNLSVTTFFFFFLKFALFKFLIFDRQKSGKMLFRKFKFELVTFQNIVGNVKNVAGHLV